MKDLKLEPNDSEIIYNLLRRDVISGELNPGKKLKIAEIRERYEFGAAPVREALARLVGDGLVNQQSQRGFRVREMSAKDVEDLGNVRILLECEGVRKSLANGSDRWEANLVAAYHSLSLAEKRPREEQDMADLEDRNRTFHDMLVEAANSPWLLELRAQIYSHHERYRYVSRRNSIGKRDTPSEHAAIFESALRRDVEGTCELITQHIYLTTEQAIEALGAD